MSVRHMAAFLGTLVLLLAACGPAATSTPVPTRSATPTRPAVATSTPLPSGGTPLPATPTAGATQVPAKAQEVKPKYGGTLVIPEREYPRSWDLPVETTTRLTRPLNLMGGKLLRYNGGPPGCDLFPLDGEIAQDWRWLNDTTLELNLRPGVRFQNLPPVNGRELTVQDILYNFKTQWPRHQWLQAPVERIARIETPDKNTVRFYLKEPWVYFVELLADKSAYIVPQELYGPDGVMKVSQDVVGTGPFLLGDRMPALKISMKRNPTYFRTGLPYLDQIDLLMMPDMGTQLAAFRSGKADLLMLEDIPPILELERTNPKALRALCPGSALPIIWMRTDQPTYSDVRVRRAIAMSIDREAIMKSVYFGKGIQAYSMVGALYPQYFLPLEEYPPEARQYLEYHPDRAKQLLAEAGFSRGFATEITATPLRRTELAIAESMVGFLKEVGIEAKLTPLSYTEWTGVVLQNKYPALGAGPADAYPLDRVWEGTHSKAGIRNRAYINDPQIDRIMDETRRERDEARRKQLFRDFQIRMAQQAYMLNFPLAPFAAFAQPQVQNLTYKGYSAHYGDFVYKIWLDR